MKKLICLALLGVALAGCNGDWGFTEPYTTMKISRKGCMAGDHDGTSSLVVNIETKYLEDGRVQCTVTTVNAKTPGK